MLKNSTAEELLNNEDFQVDRMSQEMQSCKVENDRYDLERTFNTLSEIRVKDNIFYYSATNSIAYAKTFSRNLSLDSLDPFLIKLKLALKKNPVIGVPDKTKTIKLPTHRLGSLASSKQQFWRDEHKPSVVTKLNDKSSSFKNQYKTLNENKVSSSMFHNHDMTKKDNDDYCTSESSKHKAIKIVNTLFPTEDSEFLSVFLEHKQEFLDISTQINTFPEVVPQVIEIILKIFKIEHPTKKNILFFLIKDEFVEKIVSYITLLPVDSDINLKDGVLENFIDNILLFCEKVNDYMPSKAAGALRKVLFSLRYAIKGLKEVQNLNLSETFEENICKLLEHSDCLSQRNLKTTKISETENLMEPLDNVRDIEIFPGKKDLFEPALFLRKNVVNGSYRNVDHYIDVQFRLLREDFIAPLRSGIQLYCQSIPSSHLDQKQRFDGIRVHNNVMVLHGTITNGRLGHLVQLKTDTGHRGDSKRFMFGSLLLFTADNFDSFFCGTVINSVGENLLVIELFCNETPLSNIYCKNLTMIESEVFFSPYYHVLTALKNLSHIDFPMKEYIIDVVPNNVGLIENDKYSKYFPTLNESQRKAFIAAVKDEFVIIQGPPGTGKTFLAEAITKTLLDKKLVHFYDYLDWSSDDFYDSSSDDFYDSSGKYLYDWSGNEKKVISGEVCKYNPKFHQNRHNFFSEPENLGKPILVICYTNHALDQFLERLTKWTQRLVRVGGQSKNPKIDEFNLKTIRSCWIKAQTGHRRRCNCDNCSESMEKFQRYFGRMNTVQNFTYEYLVLLKVLEVTALEGIPRVENLVPWMNSGFRNILYRQKQFKFWLLEGAYILDIKDDNINHDAEPKFIVNTQQLISEIRESNAYRDSIELFNVDLRAKAEAEAEAKILITVSKLRSFRNDIQKKLRKCKQKGAHENVIYSYENQIEDLEKQRRYIAFMLLHIPAVDLKRVRKLYMTSNIWTIDFEDRWMLYNYWKQQYENEIRNKLIQIEVMIKKEEEALMQTRNEFDLEILKSANIIGMTTTSAARLRSTLEAIAPKIVVVEEAAEVLEAHIVVAITPSVKKLILIGDHKQLRPNPAVYELAQQYQLDVSLFERMIKNEMPYHILNTQQRMRPEIASLISPAIYPDLRNGERVLDRPDIRGVAANVFFVTHNKFEDETFGDSRSHRNTHEVDFLMSLCEYLLSQDYSPSQITILATYLGQMTAFENERRRRYISTDLRITTVDNYQGEENDIILLSLVRSNAEASIGFLSAENRVCVALSRAKNGLYIVGNMDNLTVNRNIWRQVKAQLETMNAIGPALPLGCKNHKNNLSLVSCSSDFKNIPTSGCLVKCKAKLECGHICPEHCHSIDPEHTGKLACSFPCERMVCEIHRCQKPCGQLCGTCTVLVEKELPCGHSVWMRCSEDGSRDNMLNKARSCKEKVTYTSLVCGHVVNKLCHQDQGCCYEPCTSTMDCGHACVRRCHANSKEYHEQQLCLMAVDKVLGCGHIATALCKDSIGKLICKEACLKTLPCGHPCSSLCGEPCNKACETPVEKTLSPCGHQLKLPCSSDADSSQCYQPCQLALACGHPCPGTCSDDCSRFPCKEVVRCDVEPACGHQLITIPCSINLKSLLPHSDQLLQHCQAPCRAVLPCGHQCKGKCGACLQGRLHEPCFYPCTKVLKCGHKCERRCCDECPFFCDRPCVYQCPHEACSQLCGDPCTPCERECERQCRHQQCSLMCWEDCDCPPCGEHCPWTLPCGHQCPAYCGEPCTMYCIICYPDVCFVPGHPSNPDVDRYVTLVDCGHPIEVNLLKKLITGESTNGIRKCPICDKPIQFVLRFKEEMKKLLSLLENTKKEKEKKLEILEKKMKMEKSDLKNYTLAKTEVFGCDAFFVLDHLTKAPLVYKTSVRILKLFKALTSAVLYIRVESDPWKAVIERRRLLLRALSLRLHSLSSTDYKEFLREILRLTVATSNWSANSHLLFSLKKYSVDELEALK